MAATGLWKSSFRFDQQGTTTLWKVGAEEAPIQITDEQQPSRGARLRYAEEGASGRMTVWIEVISEGSNAADADELEELHSKAEDLARKKLKTCWPDADLAP
jgi:hypothetical protein